MSQLNLTPAKILLAIWYFPISQGYQLKNKLNLHAEILIEDI